MRSLLAILLVSLAQASSAPTQSQHHKGPNGLEGWTLNVAAPGVYDGEQPVALVIARNGTIVRKIEGDSFIWGWMFQAGGKEIAFETGPMHFSLACKLLDISSGRLIAQYDCFPSPLATNAPAWVQLLESNDRAFRD